MARLIFCFSCIEEVDAILPMLWRHDRLVAHRLVNSVQPIDKAAPGRCYFADLAPVVHPAKLAVYVNARRMSDPL